MKFRGLFNMFDKSISLLLVGTFALQLSGAVLFNLVLLFPLKAEAAVVTIEGTPNVTGSVHTQNGASTVFISDQVGYKFYRYGATPNNGACVYKKTNDGGDTWGSYVVFDTQSDCSGTSVWYDRWTPGDLGDYIHISTIDTSDDEIFYNRLDTTNDTLLVATSITGNPAAPGTYSSATNKNNITKGTNGRIYMVVDDLGGTSIVSCASSCNLSGSWSTVGTPPQGNADSWSNVMPLIGGNVMIINRSTANQIRSSIWNGSTWSSFTTIAASAIRNTTYDVGMAATLNTDTGDIFLAYAADNDSFTVADHDIRTAVYSSGSWSAGGDVLTNVAGRGVLQVGISRDQNNGDIYVGYTARSTIGTANTANVHYKRSTNGMTSWGAEQGPLNTLAGDLYGIDMNLMSFERIYASWFDNVAAVLDIIGNTVADIGPEVMLTTLGTQKSQVRTDSNDYHVGGTFILNTLSSRTLNTFTISETGTIHAQNDIKNVRLQYDFDTTAPYDCSSESYSGAEPQFGSTIPSGFSGANGVAAFTTSPLSFGPSQAICMYAVFDVQATADDGDTIEVEVTAPETDILVSGIFLVFPPSSVLLSGTTTVVDPNLTQSGYHWRLDNGSETTASSATGGIENTAISALQKLTPRRLRIAVANQGSTSTLSSTYQLEYGTAAPTCADTNTWDEVGASGAVWNLSNSANITDGANTTNISVGSGGVTDLGSSFITTNAALRDVNNTSGAMVLGINNFFEGEYAVVASSSALEGETYCFRLSRGGVPLSVYTEFPRVTISADVLVGSFGTQATTTEVSTNNVYSGGGFRVIENVSTRDVESIKLSELGTVNGTTGLANLRLFYEMDTSVPYNCESESYGGSELQYGATSTTGFSEAGEAATFTSTVSISTTSALCLYPVYNVTAGAQNAEVIDIAIASAAIDVVVSGGASVGPSGQVNISGETQIRGGILTQSNYHWRSDNGSETGATSATGGIENTPITDFSLNTPIRLRLGVTNTGLVANAPTRFRVEYAPRITTCDTATVWTDVDAAPDGWDMFNSSFLTNGETTTNIAVGSGGVSNGSGSFIGSNGGVRETESLTATTTIATTDYLDVEFSMTSTPFTSFGTSYCFRVSANGVPFNAYTEYAEITTTAKRDFKVQRGTVQVSGTSATVSAGVDYVAPATSSKAFVRITNSNNTGAGHNTGATTAQNADDVTAFISNPQNILTSFTVTRPTAAISNTYIDWEIVEFIGNANTDNEMVVRGASTLNFNNSALVATGTSLSAVADNSKVVVYMTGASNRNASRNFYASQVTAEWDPVTKSPVFRRGANGSSIIDISYAVVEYVGQNWNVQRVQHTYIASGVIETESITAVNSLARTFIHTQKRMGAVTNVVHFGHEVWLSSIGAVSFRLEPGADVAVGQTSVAWVVENIQAGLGVMKVQRSNGVTTGGTAPLALSVVLSDPFEAINNTSIMANTRAVGANTTYPRPMAGFKITSTSTYQIFRSNTGTALTYRVELIEWPVADLSFRQNYYRFYVNNDALTPTDPWPAGLPDLGENTSITINDEPLGISDKIRVRMTLRTANATMPPGLLNFKLQYALRISTCSAVGGGSWTDVGAAGSGTVWRGFTSLNTTDGTALSTNPPTGGDLLISVADIAGPLVHQNPSFANPYSVDEGDNIEFDWQLEQNGANPQSVYCFRVTRSDGTPLAGYSNYPQIRTVGFTPVTTNWRWYGDITNETPVTPLSAENVSPINVANNSTIALRLNVLEKRNVQGTDIKFKLQFSEDINFANPIDVVATSSCQERSLWCYSDGAGANDQLISTAVLTGGSGCVASTGVGCGRHNSSATPFLGHVHFAGVTQEYAFNIRHVAARVNAVYYFRLYDVTNDSSLRFDTGSSFPSLVTEGPILQLSLAGLPAGTTTASVVTDVSTTATGIGFGSLLINTDQIAAHRITVETNATEGYQLFSFARQQLLGPLGISIPSISSTNLAPVSWSSSCNATSTGCFGYHVTDPTLKNGSTRFAPSDTYAGLETSPVEIMYSSIPTTDVHDIVYRIRVNELQPAGNYETEVVYLAVPSY